MRSDWTARAWILILAIALSSIFVPAGESEGQSATIAGMLVGVNEDQDGNFTRVYLQDDNLGAVLVADDEMGKKLVEHAGSQVEISGRLVELDGPELGFTLVIYVESWTPLGGDEAG